MLRVAVRNRWRSRHDGLHVAVFAIAAALASASTVPAQQTEMPAVSGLHHVHMNVVDPERSMAFYLNSFELTRRVQEAAWDGIQSEDVYILFDQVDRPASAELDTALWHFGWHTPDVVGDYERLAARGVSFFRVPPPSGHITAPDGNDVEIAPGRGDSRAFNHVHLMSDAPLCAAAWYERVLGLERVPARVDAPAPTGDCAIPFGPRRDPGNQIHTPSARVSLGGGVILFIYPNQRPSRALVSSRGRVLDHIALAVDSVPAALERVRNRGGTVLEARHAFGDTTRRAAMIEGPDALRIELVER